MFITADYFRNTCDARYRDFKPTQIALNFSTRGQCCCFYKNQLTPLTRVSFLFVVLNSVVGCNHGREWVSSRCRTHKGARSLTVNRCCVIPERQSVRSNWLEYTIGYCRDQLVSFLFTSTSGSWNSNCRMPFIFFVSKCLLSHRLTFPKWPSFVKWSLFLFFSLFLAFI